MSDNRSKSSYDSLMNYLDNISIEEPHVNRNLLPKPPDDYEDSDDLSTLSYSTRSSRNSRRYIWDTVEPTSSTTDSVTYFAPPSYHSHTTSDNHTQGTSMSQLTAKIEDIKTKISAMQAELKTKNAHIKDLQTTLTRLQHSCQQKEQRHRNVWNKKISQQQQEHEEAIAKQKTFFSKLGNDVAELEKKVSLLEDKLASTTNSTAVDDAIRKCESQYNQFAQQWQAEERQSMQKLIQAKTNALQQQAANAIAPQLESLVVNHKQALIALQEKLETERIQKVTSLRQSLDAQFASNISNLTTKYHTEHLNAAQSLAMKEKHLMQKYQQEYDDVRAHFESERKCFDASLASQVQQKQHAQHQLLSQLQKIEADQLSELITSHQQHLSKLISSHNAAMLATKQQLEEEYQKYVEEVERSRRFEASEQLEHQKKAIRRRIATEFDEITEKVRQEVAAEREAVRAEFARELEAQQANCGQQAHTIEVAIERSLNLQKSVRSEIAQLTAQLHEIRLEKNKINDRILSERIMSSDDETDDATISTVQQEKEYERKLDDLQRRLEEEQSELQRKIRLEREQLEVFEEEVASRLANRKQQIREELAAVELKVLRILKGKDGVVADLQKSLLEHQELCREVEETIDEKRNKKYSAGST